MAALSTLAAIGCAEPDATNEGIETSSDAIHADELALAVPAAAATVPDPTKPYITAVKANGTGCPLGTWTPALSADGLAYTVVFSSYQIDVTPTTPISLRAKDCQLGISLYSPRGVSSAVASVSFTGYAFVGEGMKVTASANYYWQGLGQLNASEKVFPAGHDDAFLVVNDVKLPDVVAFPACGVQRELQVTTRLVAGPSVSNGPLGSAYANVTATDVNLKSKLEIKFRTKPCPTTP